MKLSISYRKSDFTCYEERIKHTKTRGKTEKVLYRELNPDQFDGRLERYPLRYQNFNGISEFSVLLFCIIQTLVVHKHQTHKTEETFIRIHFGIEFKPLVS